MIDLVEGHWRNRPRPPRDLNASTLALTDKERAAFEAIMREYATQGHSPTADQTAQLSWAETPLPIEQWLDSTEHIGDTAKGLWPSHKQHIANIFNGGYHEVIYCLHPDTKVPLVDGSMPTIKALADEWEQARQPFWVYAWKDGAISPHLARAPHRTGTDDYFKITLDDGSTFTANARHEMLTPAGTKVQVRDMRRGTSLMPFNVRLSTQCPVGYEQIEQSNGEWTFTHRLAAHHVLKEAGNEDVIHHVNFTKLDNRPENLRWMTWTAHRDLHASHMREWMAANPERERARAERLREVMQERWNGPDGDAMRTAHAARLRTMNATGMAVRAGKLSFSRLSPEAQAALRTRLAARNKLGLERRDDVTIGRLRAVRAAGAVSINAAARVIGCSASRIRRVLNQHGQTQSDFFGSRRGAGSHSSGPPLTLDAIKGAVAGGAVTLEAVGARLGRAGPSVLRVVKKHGLCWKDVSPTSQNHFVVSIEPAGRGPVYCLNVPTAGNFAIATNKPDSETNEDRTGYDVSARCGVVSGNTGSVGYGKDYAGITCILRVLYELNCLNTPAQSLGLGPGEQIHIVPVSRTLQLAKRVVFTGLIAKLALSPWFKGRYKETQDYIYFPDKNIYIIGGAVSDAGILGMNVYAAIVDEANFMGAQRAKDKATTAGGAAPDKAQAVYDGLVRRVKSRFERSNLKGLTILISSKRSTGDFTERRIKEAITANESGVYVVDMNTWMALPSGFTGQTWHRISLDQKTGRCRVLADNEGAVEGSITAPFPGSYLSMAKRDPVGFMRDMVGIATDAYAPFIADRVAVDEMMSAGLPSIFRDAEWTTGEPIELNWEDARMEDARGDWAPTCCPGATRHVHIDLSKNKCATGFCVGHQAGFVEMERPDPDTGAVVLEAVPVFHLDGVLRIVAKQGLDIDHGEVRWLVYRLIEGGFNVRSVSMDQWMSVPNEQEFQRHGLRTEVISTVRTPDPYLAARGAILERRVSTPEHDTLRDELLWLEMDGNKIVASATRSKDVADSFAGCIYYLSRHATGGQLTLPSRNRNTPQTRAAALPYRVRDGNLVWADEDEDGDDQAPRSFGPFAIR